MPGTQRENKVIECLAAVAWEPNKPLVIESVQVEPPQGDEVRIKAERSGICYGDVAMLTGNFPEMRFPCILGHECAAIVESVGENVTDVRRGDLVITLWNSQCGECEDCVDPKKRFCDVTYKTRANASGITCRGQKIFKIGPLAAFSEYSNVPKYCVLKIDEKAPVERISPFSCSIPTGYQAAKNIAKVKQWSNVVIFGLGVIGLSVALACRDNKAKRIIGVDTNSNKFKIAKIFGCTDFINPDECEKSLPDTIKEITNGGADYAFVCFSGKQTAENAIEACKVGASQTILIGLTNNEEKIETHFLNFFSGKTVTGTWCGAYRDVKEVKELLDRYMSGKMIEVDYFTTHAITLDKINQGIETKTSGTSIRTEIIF